MNGQVNPLDFFDRLVWLDGRPLLSTIENYRRRLFVDALFRFRSDGSPLINQVLSGRAKKNWKTTDLVLAALYRLLIWRSPPGFDNNCFIIANDEAQAGDDLNLCRKLIAVNPVLSAELAVYAKEIRRRDNGGVLRILPAGDALGAHGKSYVFLGLDEIHGMKDWRLLEALQPDPTRSDALLWCTSYDTLWDREGVPLHDMKAAGLRGDDPRFHFSWFSADLCTDPAFAELPPEDRANPSMASWPEGRQYLDQQRRRLPTHKFRRLHLNLPGSPDGAFLDQGTVLDAIVAGRRQLGPRADCHYFAFVDMSGGSSDDATCAVAHVAAGKVIVDFVISQAGEPPFNPRSAVTKFAREIKPYRIREVVGDAYAGETFRYDFESQNIRYRVSSLTTSEAYEAFEPRLNAGEIELPDVPKLQEQLLGLVYRGSRIDHQSGEHDDWSASVAGVVAIAMKPAGQIYIGSYGEGGPIHWQHEKVERKRLWRRRLIDENGNEIDPPTYAA